MESTIGGRFWTEEHREAEQRSSAALGSGKEATVIEFYSSKFDSS